MIAEIQHVAATDERRRWMLTVLCLGALLSGLNSTIVNVALPSIQADLGLTDAALVWVISAYVTSAGGFLLLGGRLGDFFGGRRVLLAGVGIFVVASLACGLATSPLLLVLSRLAQGVGGAVLSAAGFAEITKLFTDARQRARAAGLYICVSASGGSIGLLLGGILVGVLTWQWVFLINIPIGTAMYVLCFRFLPRERARPREGSLDIVGATTSTASLLSASYAIVEASQAGWTPLARAALIASVALLTVFVYVEKHVRLPLIPLRLFRLGNLAVASIAGAVLVTALVAWRLFEALYLQRVLELTPLQVGLSFVPANVTIAVISLVVLPTLISRFGLRRPIVWGMLSTAMGLASLARAEPGQGVGPHVVLGMLLLGLGVGLAYNALLLSAMRGIDLRDAGAASGIVTTAATLGSSLGVSALGGIAAVHTNALLASGTIHRIALSSGYTLAFWVAAIAVATAACMAGFWLQEEQGAFSNSA